MLLTLWGCQGNSRGDETANLKGFNEYLGKDKADALDQAVESFDDFLSTNYPDKETPKDRTRAFLKDLERTYGWADSNWIFKTGENKEILEKLETSGMRREIEEYGYEKEYRNPYDSTLNFNMWGQYITGLDKYAQDSIIQGYVSDKLVAGNINMVLVVRAFLNPDIDYDNPFIKRIIVVEMYRDLMRWDIKRAK